MTSYVRKDGNDLILLCHLQPGAKRSEFVGLHGERIKIRLNAPPVDGKANTALIALFADVLGLHKRSVSVVAGRTARLKRVRVDGVTADEVSKIMS